MSLPRTARASCNDLEHISHRCRDLLRPQAPRMRTSMFSQSIRRRSLVDDAMRRPPSDVAVETDTTEIAMVAGYVTVRGEEIPASAGVARRGMASTSGQRSQVCEGRVA